MREVSPGVFEVRLALVDTGVFAAKTCFLPDGGCKTEWPSGGDVIIKTAPAWTCRGVSVYTAFPRQFLPGNAELAVSGLENAGRAGGAETLDENGWTVIPPSGTFRDLIRHLDEILVEERFRIIQLLPIHPVPTTFARMGRYGSPFAGTDFLSVDPSLAEFDRKATPLEQFGELVNAVHARGARIFLDIPANHTGWASTLQCHHPEWFKKDGRGRFISPGAWGVVWEDLAELDYSHPGLRRFMADVFEFWCMHGADGFRCDAGYKVPAEVWRYISARVRRNYPDTVFMLEGLGGEISVTESLVLDNGLDWAYSEIFQTEDRSAFERYLPSALRMSFEIGPLVNFAETHDNNRMAAKSRSYASMRTALAALIAHQGCFGVTNGVEWFAAEKIDVHGCSALNWGAENQKALMGRLNAILSVVPAFGPGASVKMVQCADGNSLAVVRSPARSGDIDGSREYDAEGNVLVLVNLDATSPQNVSWPEKAFPDGAWSRDLMGGAELCVSRHGGVCSVTLGPGAAACIPARESDADAVSRELASAKFLNARAVRRQEFRAVALRIRAGMFDGEPLSPDDDVDAMAEALAADPVAFFHSMAAKVSGAFLPRLVQCVWPEDTRRRVMVLPGCFVMVRAPYPFRCRVDMPYGGVLANLRSVELDSGDFCVVFCPSELRSDFIGSAVLSIDVGTPGMLRRDKISLMTLPEDIPSVRRTFSGAEVRDGDLAVLLTNGRGAMSHVRARWGEVLSQYDAILAANPDPEVPCDRIMLFTRCRIWVVNRGFSSEIGPACLEWFSCAAGSGSAAWRFRVPVGTGKSVLIDLSLVLKHGENSVRIQVHRRLCEGDPELLSDADDVCLIFRPDVESRSFHCKTKAFSGPENEWPGCVRQVPGGFVFAPHGTPGVVMRISDGAFVSEPEWHYMVAHPIDASRGQDGFSDLYSPGWFTADVSGGDTVCLEAYMNDEASPHRNLPQPDDSAVFCCKPPVCLSEALRGALRDFVVKRGSMSTVIAGYPWFLDWGRDTFIVLRGMIAADMTDEALGVIRKFGEYEADGTLPNMINGADASNRDTSDAQLWYLVACADLAERVGVESVFGADCAGRSVRDVALSITRGYLKGTPNGIAVDAESGLVYSPAHFTWMDTNYPAGTPRSGYPVEIQALWTAALKIVSIIDPYGGWEELRRRAMGSIRKLFWNPSRGFLSDCLHCETFVPAESAVADDHLRCNQLFAVTLDAVEGDDVRERVVWSSARLLIPGGIRTLSPGRVEFKLPVRGRSGELLNDPSCPYQGRYEGDEDTRRKPAYHNGTAWTWPYPSFAEAMLNVYGNAAHGAAAALIGACVPLLESGCVGHLPEIMDGDAPHTGRGCDAQAWGASEFLRMAVKLGL